MLLFAALVACWAVAAAQPCHEKTDCFDGYFCDILSDFKCRPCLKCKDLKREEPPLMKSCVESVKECGSCFKDLVNSRSGDLTCVSRVEGEAPAADNSATLWIVAGVVIAIFLIIVAAVVIRYLFRNTSIFKVHLDTNIGATLPTHVVATAPESPPPYSATHAPDLPKPGEDTEHPLIKPYQPPFPAYESLDRQEVSMFNPPAYVRLNNLTPRQPEGYNDVNDNYSLPVPDEDTTPSPWVPGTNYTATPASVEVAFSAVNGAPAGPQPLEGPPADDFSTGLALARNTELIQPHPPHAALRVQSMNNDGEEASSGDEAHAHHTTHGGSSRQQRPGNGNYNVMNVNQIITIIKPPLDKQRSF